MSTLKARALPEGLQFRVVTRPSQTHVFFRLTAEILAGSVCLYWVRDTPYLLILGAGAVSYCILRDLTHIWRRTDVMLTVTATELISRGHAPPPYLPLRTPLAYCSDLVWRPAEAGKPEGIYLGINCVLPLVPENEAHPMLEEIYKRVREANM